MMGILTKKYEDSWVIEIRETWMIGKLKTKEVEEFELFLSDNEVDHNKSYYDINVGYNFSNSELKFKEFKEFIEVLNRLLMFKFSYGDLKEGDI